MLADFQPEWRDVTFKGGGFKVRGLSLEDLSILIRTHLEDLQGLVKQYMTADLKDGIPQDIILGMVRDSPMLAAHVIASAAGESSAAEQARALPFPLQIEAIGAVLQLTFEDVGGPKNFVSLLMTMLAGMGVDLPSRLVAKQVPTIQ